VRENLSYYCYCHVGLDEGLSSPVWTHCNACTARPSHAAVCHDIDTVCRIQRGEAVVYAMYRVYGRVSYVTASQSDKAVQQCVKL